MKPLALRDALLLQNVGDQLVVYDPERKRLHVLSRSAALVWQYCDGQRDVAQLAEAVGRELGSTVDSDVIMLALQQLDEAQLLKTPQQPERTAGSVTRREMMTRALSGLAAGVLMPVVTSCGSIVDSTLGVTTRSGLGVLEVTTPPGTTTSSTTPLGTTTTSTTAPPGTTTTSTTPPPGTTTTSTSPPPGTTTTTTTVATTTTPPPKKVRMCHNGKTIMVDARAVSAHLAKGDTLGACP